MTVQTEPRAKPQNNADDGRTFPIIGECKEDFPSECRDVASLGNGYDEPLSKSQLDLIQKLYDRVCEHRERLVQACPHDSSLCDR
mmetsp:Transcript_18447/g.53195  ORF Transcript_18447/g.53195 Transcript_18447/m.53195 type:complete len:85 (+) Transcript_18447:74-328(+)